MGQHFERGQMLFDLGRYREAAKEYLAELAEEPDHVASHISLAAALCNVGDISAAFNAIETAISRDPESAHSYCILSHIELSHNNVKKAAEAILEALRLRPCAEYFVLLAKIRHRQGRKIETLAASAAALEHDPSHVPAILFHGQILLNSGRREEANQLFAAALRESPEEPSAQQAMGRLSLAKGDAVSALALLTEARRTDPLNANDRSAIAEAYGLTLFPFRGINHLIVRWYLWSFQRQWLLCVVLTLVFSLASLEINVESRHALFEHPWWTLFCIFLANYLLLPFSIGTLARSTAYFVAKRMLDIRWYSLLLQPAILPWKIFQHGFVSFVGLIASIIPELMAMIFALWTCHPLVATMARSGVRQLTYYVCLPVLIFPSILMVIALSIIPYIQIMEMQIFAGILFAFFFAITYYNERLARWSSSIQLF